MRLTVVLLAGLAAADAVFNGTLKARDLNAGKAKAEQAYFVRFARAATPKARAAHLNWLEGWTKKDTSGHVYQGLKHTFDTSLSGYSALMPPGLMQIVMKRPEIASMSPAQQTVAVPVTHTVTHRRIQPVPQPVRTVPQPVRKVPQPVWQSAQTGIHAPRPAARAKMSVSDALPVHEPSTAIAPQRVKTVQSTLMQARNRGWNAARISHQRYTPGYRLGTYVHSQYLGQGTDIFVLDSGLANLHGFLPGKVTVGRNFVRGSVNTDVSGHGTMVTALISSRAHGLAPGARVTSLKVANDNNIVSSDDVLAALEYIASLPGNPNLKIVSLSQYFPWSSTINSAFDSLSKKGIHVVVAAGNDGKDACSYSPGSMARSSSIITVGSVDGTNAIPIRGRNGALEGSNIGRCVSIFAPGSKVPTLPAKKLAPNTSYFGYGTSLATPQVAAIAAVTLSAQGAMTPAELKKVLVDRSVKGQIVGHVGGSLGGILWNGLA